MYYIFIHLYLPFFVVKEKRKINNKQANIYNTAQQIVTMETSWGVKILKIVVLEINIG